MKTRDLMTRLNTYITKAACVLLAAFVSSAARAEGETMQLGNCKDNIVTFFNVTKNRTGGSALYFPEPTMQMYTGCRITEMHVAVGEPTGEDSLRVFITKELDGEPLYEQYCKAERRNWNTVTLDTPFELDGTAVYIGYEVEGQYYLCYSEAFLEGEEWINQGSNGWQPFTNIYSAAFYAVVSGDNLPANNIRLGHVSMPGYSVVNERLAFNGQFINLGLDDVESLTFTYYVDGQPIGDETVEVETTANRATGTFNLEGISFAESGDAAVSLVVTAVNGETDADPSDNYSRTKNVRCLDEFVRRNVLFELFSTERCTSCPGVHSTIDPIVDGLENVVEIGHHAGFYTDDLTIPESVEYEWFYGGGRLYAPAMMFDRTSFVDNLPSYYTEDCPVAGVNSEHLLNAYAEAIAVPAFAEVNIAGQLDRESRKLALTVSGKQLLPLSEPDRIGLYVFLTEDSVYSTTQAGAAGGFYHRHVARLSLTPTWGQSVDVENGFTSTFEAEIPEDWNIDMLRAVAFVAYYDPEDCQRCEVLNSMAVRVADCGSTGIGHVIAGNKDVDVLFDGSNIIVPNGCTSVSVYDMSGRCVLRNSNGGTFTSVDGLPRGGYVVKVTSADKQTVIKMKR